MKNRSIARRYAMQMGLLSIAGVAIIAFITFQAVAMWQSMRQQDIMAFAAQGIDEVLSRNPDTEPAEMWQKLDELLLNIGTVRARIYGPGNEVLYGPATLSEDSSHQKQNTYPLQTTSKLMPMTQLELALDTREDERLLNFLMFWFTGATVTWGIAVLLLSGVLAKLGLKPLNSFGVQISRLDPLHPQTRISESISTLELAPVIQQFHRLMDKVAEYQEQLRSFNSNVAHELNTPLANLTVSHELLLRSNVADNSPLHEALYCHLEELQRMNRIIQSMLLLSQLVQGQFNRPGPIVQVSQLIAPVVDYMEALLEDRNLRCEVVGDAEVDVEPELFKRAVSNLLSNAVRYADPCSTIHITVQSQAELQQVSILVRNIGTAIPEHLLPRLFEAFYRVDDSRNASQHNHGLGLAIVAAIAKLHGGKTMAVCAGNEVSIGFTVAL